MARELAREVSLGIRSRNELQEAAKLNGTTLNIVDCRPMERDTMVMMMDIAGPEDKIESTVESIQGLKGVRHAYKRSGGEGGLRLIAVVDRPGVCRSATGSAIMCLDCPFNSTEVPASWRFVVKKADDVAEVIRRLGDEDIGADIVGIAPFERPVDSVTDQSVVKAAIENGYFEFPRRLNLNELGRIVGLPPERVAEILNG